MSFYFPSMKAHFPIDAKSAVDHAKRKENFAKVHAAITKHNNHKNSTYKMGHNKFSAMVRATMQCLTVH